MYLRNRYVGNKSKYASMFEKSGFLQRGNCGKYVLRSSETYELVNFVESKCIFGELENLGLEEFMYSRVVDFESCWNLQFGTS